MVRTSRTSSSVISFTKLSAVYGIRAVRTEAHLGDRRFRALPVELAAARQCRESCLHHGFRRNLEELPEVLAILAATESVGAERIQPSAKPRCKLIRHGLHVIARRNDGTGRAFERLDDVRSARLACRMQAIPA